MEGTSEKYLVLHQDADRDVETEKSFITEGWIPLNKDAYSDEPKIHYFGLDSGLDDQAAQYIVECIAARFLSFRTKDYLLKQTDIFTGVDA